MTIQYHVREVNQPDGTKKLCGQVITPKTLGTEELIIWMQMHGCTVTTADMIAVIEALSHICKNAVLAGNRVKIDKLCTLYPVMKGVFDSYDEAYNPTKHYITVKAIAPSALRRTVRANAKVERVKRTRLVPVIETYENLLNKSATTTITPGTICRLTGSYLKINKVNPDEGIYIVDRNNNSNQIQVQEYVTTTPSEIIFMVPNIDAAFTDIKLTLITRSRKNAKSTKTASYGKALTVVQPVT